MSTEPTGSAATVNGSSIVSKEDDTATDSADEFPPGAVSHSTATTTTSRSVSATLQHERRERSRGAGARASPRTSAASDSRVGTHRTSHAHSNAPPQQQQQQQHGILNYIFGQNGPGPIGANSAVSAASVLSSAGSGSVTLQGVADGVAASGRDVSGGADGVFRSGLLAGKHDGNNAAYDMKSLGKHIEAVRSSALSPPWPCVADTDNCRYNL